MNLGEARPSQRYIEPSCIINKIVPIVHATFMQFGHDTVQQLAARIADGCKLAIPKDASGVAMSVTRALIERRARALHLVCVPIGGLAADMLIGSGCVSCVETSAVTLGEYGGAPRFNDAVRNGKIRILDATCPAIYAGLQATEKGIPFLPLRGLIGSDILRYRTDWKRISNPYQADDELVAIAAIQPDVALFHAPVADRFGNVFVGIQRELMIMAHAAKETLVSVERLSESNLLENEVMAGAVIPSTYISAVAHAPRGAAPLGFASHYVEDEALLLEYSRAAQSATGFDEFMQRWPLGAASQATPLHA
jgi:glutaconate CoA-transferase subunit A